MGSLQSSTLTWGNSWSSSPLLGTPLLPALTLSPVKNARLEQLPLLTVCCLMQALLTGPDENCKIISGPGSAKEEMDKYLNACGVIGQPITNDGTTGGTCIEGPNNECAATCNGACQDCS